MSQIIVPRGVESGTGRAPRLVDYVETYLRQMRAPLRQRTVFTPAGRGVVHAPGERIIYGPRGQKIRVIELPEGGNQIEHGNERGHGVEHLHAHVRPRTVTNIGRVGALPRSSRSLTIPRR